MTLPQQQQQQQSSSSSSSCCCCSIYWLRCCHSCYETNEFLILAVAAIVLARAYPPLGAVYLAPEITATWIAVMFIFFMAGLGMKTAELYAAASFGRLRFNATVQVFNFGVVSAAVFGVSRLLANRIGPDLADGMVVAASLPMTVNMVLVLTKAAGGDEAAAIFNATAGNLIRVFLSPLLILGYLGVSSDIHLPTVFTKLAVRVVLPVAAGQIVQKTCREASEFVRRHKTFSKRAQLYCLVFIVYTVFCGTFLNGTEAEEAVAVQDIIILIVAVFVIILSLMGLAWFIVLKVLFPTEPALRVMGLFGCTHKTVAMGVPLITAMYDGQNSAAAGLYTLPLLIWHPTQLLIGTAVAPKLAAYVKQEQERLEQHDDMTDRDNTNIEEQKEDDNDDDEEKLGNDFTVSLHSLDDDDEEEEKDAKDASNVSPPPRR